MLKELLAIFEKDSKLDEAFRMSFEMLDITKDMFQKAKRTLRETDTIDLDTSLQELDRKVNKYQREVRKDVLQHLSVAGVMNLATGITLIGIIIDLERIGDYTKNIVELAESHRAKLAAGKREEDLIKVEKALTEVFDRIKDVLKSNDEPEAEAIVKDYAWVNPLCDRHIKGFIEEEDESLPRSSVVALALYFRFLKRIHSHLRNIATTVYRPFHKIGFIPNKVKDLDD